MHPREHPRPPVATAPLVMLVCGARPNFIKVAPILDAMRKSGRLVPYLVHTGQHYDERMSKSFFDVLRIPRPDIDLRAGSGSHAEQTARIMLRFERLCHKKRPDAVVVVGDVNSTMACAIVAKKLGIPCAHVEAGLRSFDRRMPEEINRVVTDSICDLFFTTDVEASRNLFAMGIAPNAVHMVGNVMIDTLRRNREAAEASPVLESLGLRSRAYCLLTMHRPANVDDREVLGRLVAALETVQARVPMVFPAHPRSVKMLESFGHLDRMRNWKRFRLCEPLDYRAMLKLTAHARFVITDSGGLQEETTALGIPCITIRENTERPATVRTGTNEVVGTESAAINDAVQRILADRWKKGRIPRMWDGRASERIVAVLETALIPSRDAGARGKRGASTRSGA